MEERNPKAWVFDLNNQMDDDTIVEMRMAGEKTDGYDSPLFWLYLHFRHPSISNLCLFYQGHSVLFSLKTYSFPHFLKNLSCHNFKYGPFPEPVYSLHLL